MSNKSKIGKALSAIIEYRERATAIAAQIAPVDVDRDQRLAELQKEYEDRRAAILADANDRSLELQSNLTEANSLAIEANNKLFELCKNRWPEGTKRAVEVSGKLYLLTFNPNNGDGSLDFEPIELD